MEYGNALKCLRVRYLFLNIREYAWGNLSFAHFQSRRNLREAESFRAGCAKRVRRFGQTLWTLSSALADDQ